MLLLFGMTALGAGIGGMVARKRGGNRMDIAQYAGGFGIMGFLVGLALVIAIARIAGA